LRTVNLLKKNGKKSVLGSGGGVSILSYGGEKSVGKREVGGRDGLAKHQKKKKSPECGWSLRGAKEGEGIEQ